MMLSKILLCLLQVYFILMNLTVERAYCERELVDQDPGLLMQETYDFSVKHNRLFLERPEWLQKATCLHCWIFPYYYATVFFISALHLWHIQPLSMICMAFGGAKLNAIGFYHFMEFTSHVPPQNLIPYFVTEGPYLVSIAMVFYNIYMYGASGTAVIVGKTKQK